jgi:hypothetical protein
VSADVAGIVDGAGNVTGHPDPRASYLEGLMIHRLAISIGTIAAAAVLALGFAASGLGPSAAPVDAGQAALADPETVAEPLIEDATAKPITRVETTTIYVKPPPKPKVIRVTKRDPTPAPRRRTVKATPTTRQHDTREREREHHEEDDGHEEEDD